MSLTRGAITRIASPSMARRMNIACRHAEMSMRLTRVPRCGRISTKPSSASRPSASDTGKRETPRRWQIASLRMNSPGVKASRTIASRISSWTCWVVFPRRPRARLGRKGYGMSSDAVAACAGIRTSPIESMGRGCMSLLLAGVGRLPAVAGSAFQHVDQMGAQLSVLDADEGAHDAQALLGGRAVIPIVVGERGSGGRNGAPAPWRGETDDIAGWYGGLVIHDLRLANSSRLGKLPSFPARAKCNLAAKPVCNLKCCESRLLSLSVLCFFVSQNLIIFSPWNCVISGT